MVDNNMLYRGRMSKQTTDNKDAINRMTRERVDAWAEWSLKGHTMDEIRQKYIEDESSVCTAYICEVNEISSKDIDELMVLSTGLISWVDYENGYYDMLLHDLRVKNRIIKDETYKYNDEIERYYRMPIKDINDKIDWKAVSGYRNLSIEFIESHIQLLDVRQITLNYEFPEWFIKKYHKALDMFAVSATYKLSKDFISQNNKILKYDSLMGNANVDTEWLKTQWRKFGEAGRDWHKKEGDELKKENKQLKEIEKELAEQNNESAKVSKKAPAKNQNKQQIRLDDIRKVFRMHRNGDSGVIKQFIESIQKHIRYTIYVSDNFIKVYTGIDNSEKLTTEILIVDNLEDYINSNESNTKKFKYSGENKKALVIEDAASSENKSVLYMVRILHTLIAIELIFKRKVKLHDGTIVDPSQLIVADRTHNIHSGIISEYFDLYEVFRNKTKRVVLYSSAEIFEKLEAEEATNKKKKNSKKTSKQ